MTQSQPAPSVIQVKIDTPQFFETLLGMLGRVRTCQVTSHCSRSHRIEITGYIPQDIRDGIKLMGATIMSLHTN